MALADRTRQSGDAATRWPITVLLSNGSVLEPLGSFLKRETLSPQKLLPPCPKTSIRPKRRLGKKVEVQDMKFKRTWRRKSKKSRFKNEARKPGTGRAVHLDTVQMPTATHSDRCLEIFHYSSAVSGWWAIKPCSFEHHS